MSAPPAIPLITAIRRCAGPSPRRPSRGCATRRSCAAGRSPRCRPRPPCRSRRCSRSRRGRCRSSSGRRRRGSRARRQPLRDAERVLAADRDERVEALGREVLEYAVDAASTLYGFRARRAEDRPASREEPGDLARAERRVLPVDEPPPALANTDHLVAAGERAARDRADHRVQAGAVASAGEDPTLTPLFCLHRAEVAELADAPDSKSGGLRAVWVRPPPSALTSLSH